MKLLSIGGWQDGLTRFQSWWMSDPAAVQGQKWAGYSATLPVWRFTIKELIFAQHKRAEYFQIRFAFLSTFYAKSTGLWWRFENRHKCICRSDICLWHTFTFCLWMKHIFSRFLSQKQQTHKRNIKTTQWQTEPRLECQAVFWLITALRRKHRLFLFIF